MSILVVLAMLYFLNWYLYTGRPSTDTDGGKNKQMKNIFLYVFALLFDRCKPNNFS